MSIYVMSRTEVEILDDGGLQLVELSPMDPWLADPREPLELQEGEVKVCIKPFKQSPLTPYCIQLLHESMRYFDTILSCGDM